MTRLLTEDEIARQLPQLPGWRRDGDTITATYAAPTFPDAIRLVDEVALEAEDINHHPDIDIRWRKTTWALTTHDAGGLTQLDVELAHRIARHATALGSSAE